MKRCIDCAMFQILRNTAEETQKVSFIKGEKTETITVKVDTRPFEGHCDFWNENYLLNAEACIKFEERKPISVSGC